MLRSRRGIGASITPGTAEVEDILCPDGWNVVVDKAGNPMCDNGTGFTLPPVYRPSTHLANDLGVVGWSIAVAMTLVVGAALMYKGDR